MRLLVTSDTHARTVEDLPSPLVSAADEADAVVHAGDVTSLEALQHFEDRTALHAVHGNADSAEVREALPRRTVVEADGVRVCVVHGHDPFDVTYEAAETGAHLVVHGHTHTPLYREHGVPSLNPGSPTRPRGSADFHYAWLVCEDGRYSGRVVTLEGETVFEFEEETEL